VAGNDADSEERPRVGRILVAVGHEPTREDLVGVLSAAGHEVTPAADAAQVLAALGAQPFDCILCGLGLPGMDDGAFVSMLSDQYPGVRDRIVLVATEDATAGSNWHAAGTGIPCIEPPLTIENVIGAVREALPRETADGTHG
jgi:CheY-like chemotaxis protein